MTYRLALCALLLLPVATISSPGQTAALKKQQASQHIRAAQQYLQQQRPDLAIPELQKAVSLEPQDVDVRGNLGVLLYFRGDYAGAIPELRAAVKLKPELWKLQGLLGLAEERTGADQASRADLEAAFPHLTEQKFKTEVGNALITSYNTTGETEKAAAIVSQLLADQPTNTSLLYASYRLYSDLADKALVTMALTDPDGALMHEMMARELARHGDEAQAIVNYREALKLNPHLPAAHFELGELLYNSSDQHLQEQAEAEFQLALADNPTDEKTHLVLGDAAAKRGDTKTAFSEYSRAVELQPNDADALVELGKVLMTMNQNDKAQATFEQAVKADPSNTVARYRLSMLYRRQGKTAEADQQMAEYKTYKEMSSKLEKIFHDMRVGSLQKNADDADAQR
ncbi:MAG TPA: tetratricopeptide repeat protein [Acidobacteriaceae bacterium]|nr:tetratricopeptide repeat protein [Acidobacteriaceae bacterium]